MRGIELNELGGVEAFRLLLCTCARSQDLPRRVLHDDIRERLTVDKVDLALNTLAYTKWQPETTTFAVREKTQPVTAV